MYKLGPSIFCVHLLFFSQILSPSLLESKVFSSFPSWNWHHEFYSWSKEASGDGTRLLKVAVK